MLFGIVYTPRHSSEAAGASIQLFTNWQPPVEFKDHWGFATGGGMGLVEADSSAALAGSIAPFTPFFEFTLEQVDNNDEGVPPLAMTSDWHDRVA
jgi:hypothetical protein